MDLQPWQAQAVYSRAPFAPISEKGMFDSATGKWAPAKFHNYVTGEWIDGRPSTDVTIPEGTWDPVLGRTYVQIAREGWGEQKSQYGGASPQLSEPATAAYHLWGVTPGAAAGRQRAARTTRASSRITKSKSTPALKAWRGWQAAIRRLGLPMGCIRYRRALLAAYA